MKRFSLELIAVTLITLLSGGCFGEFEQDAMYDVPVPEVKVSDTVIGQIGTIRNLSGSDRRFLWQESDNRMKTDSNRFWVLSPEVAVEKILRGYFLANGEISNGILLNVIIRDFEFYRKNDREYARFSVVYQWFSSDKGSFNAAGEFSCEVKNHDYSSAMAEAIVQSFKTLVKIRESKPDVK